MEKASFEMEAVYLVILSAFLKWFSVTFGKMRVWGLLEMALGI